MILPTMETIKPITSGPKGNPPNLGSIIMGFAQSVREKTDLGFLKLLVTDAFQRK